MVETFNNKAKHIDDTLQFISMELVKIDYFVKEVREREMIHKKLKKYFQH